jgi:DnaD/phage-associated family protein
MAFCKFSTEYIANNKTEVDNLFINEYLPDAPDNCVKVYLYGLFLCNSGEIIDNALDKFSKHLGLDEDEVITCFMYWQEQGLVQVLSTYPVEIRFTPLKNIGSGTKLYKTDKYDVFNRQAQELFEGKREISKSEYAEYYDFMERYHMEQEALLMIIKYCIDTKKANVGYTYILTVARNWASEGILTAQQVEEKLCEFEENSSELGVLLSALRIKRQPYIEEKALYKKWTDELGFGADIILYVANKIKTKTHPTFDKIDGILMKYYTLGLFSVMEIENYEQNKQKLYNLAKQVNNAIGVYYENLDMVVDNYISKWINLGLDEETILEIASYCRKVSVRSLEGLDNKIQKFSKLGLVTVEALHSYLNEIIETDNEIQEILDKLALPRKVNFIDRELYKTWKAWNMSKELIMYASELAAGKSMQYLNSILANWHNSDVRNVEEAKKETCCFSSKACKLPRKVI